MSFARLDKSSNSIGWYLSRVPLPGCSVFGRDLIRIIGEYNLLESEVESTISDSSFPDFSP